MDVYIYIHYIYSCYITIVLYTIYTIFIWIYHISLVKWIYIYIIHYIYSLWCSKKCSTCFPDASRPTAAMASSGSHRTCVPPCSAAAAGRWSSSRAASAKWAPHHPLPSRACPEDLPGKGPHPPQENGEKTMGKQVRNPWKISSSRAKYMGKWCEICEYFQQMCLSIGSLRIELLKHDEGLSGGIKPGHLPSRKK